MSVGSFINRIFSWWNDQTFGTQLYTWRRGVKVGEDEQGNVFYRTKDDKKRWVIYNGEVEASRIGADWHGWLHRTLKEPPTEKPLEHKPWEQPHQENLTGTAMAYAPAGSLRQPVPADRRDYEAWSPE
ncbi:NADH:ubiquinone oxidoreductase subunit NDUFA12 [Shimia biformata]|uniref:NADH:ubiquinone oxidoreductase subunit NDUFA12 n=1 Tax=Shimia biformata TaxID=1294299 RepID=UPI0019514720|nr:NADH:ubiquinone oxidoreductase subunit NDUFA12 [Shimia biformata]